MLEKNKLWIRITVDILCLVFLAGLSKRWGTIGEIAFGIMFLFFVAKWVRRFYLSRTICVKCDRAVYKNTRRCPYCDSDDIATIEQLKQRKQQVKALLHIVHDKDQEVQTRH